jgi:subtilase family serine protease
MAGSFVIRQSKTPCSAAITAIANQKAAQREGFLNRGIYRIGQNSTAYPASFHDLTSGTNLAGEFDSSNNPVIATGFCARIGWAATTGFGTPISSSAVNYLIANVMPDDKASVLNTIKPKSHPRPIVPGHMKPN